ncbi:20315_t:CDS:2, partial [Entrophospora sp. SA101]
SLKIHDNQPSDWEIVDVDFLSEYIPSNYVYIAEIQPPPQPNVGFSVPKKTS